MLMLFSVQYRLKPTQVYRTFLVKEMLNKNSSINPVRGPGPKQRIIGYWL